MKIFALLITSLISFKAFAQYPRFSILRTGTASTTEASVFEGGNLAKKITLNHSAFLIQHGDDLFLFDTGLGDSINQQFKTDMPWWGKIFFGYKTKTSAEAQLHRESLSVHDIFLSHVHWDHASGLVDFPGSNIYTSPEELYEKQHIKMGTVFPSQIKNLNANWLTLNWQNKAYYGFPKSFDLYGDESVVFVPLPGHTTGSMGLFLKTQQNVFFLVGDLTWNLRALKQGREKMLAASLIVDRNRNQLKQTMDRVRRLMTQNPRLKIIPAHDSEVQDQLGYFPNWIE